MISDRGFMLRAFAVVMMWSSFAPLAVVTSVKSLSRWASTSSLVRSIV